MGSQQAKGKSIPKSVIAGSRDNDPIQMMMGKGSCGWTLGGCAWFLASASHSSLYCAALVW